MLRVRRYAPQAADKPDGANGSGSEESATIADRVTHESLLAVVGTRLNPEQRDSSGAFAVRRLKSCFDPRAVGRTCLDGGHRLRLALLLGVRRLVDRLGIGVGDADQSVVVADDKISRLDHHSFEGDRPVDFAGTVLVRTSMRDPRREHRKTVLAHPTVITNSAVDDD